jgi:hypothetical protein
MENNWKTCGKTIRKLIEELRTFENQDLEVKISVDDRVSSFPISLVGKSGGCCLLIYCPPVADESINIK